VRPSRFFVVAAALSFAAPSAHAEDATSPGDGTLAFMTGTAIALAGFGVGGLLLTTDGMARSADNAGWLTIQSGFVIAPLAAHGVAGEWARGLLFAAPPAAMDAGTATLLAIHPEAVRHGDLTQQRFLWGFFGVGLFTSAFGVVDATFAAGRARALSVAPRVGSGEVGIQIGGVL
jgi:hypothetical protein